NYFLFIAQHLHADFFIDRRARHDDGQISGISYLFAVELRDDIADFHARLVGRSVFGNVCHQRAVTLIHAKTFGNLGGYFLDQHAEVAARNFAFAAQLRQQLFHEIDGYRKTDPDVAAAPGEYRGVDPDHFAAQIDQRAARVSRVDRGVGLNEVVVRALIDMAPFGADDSRSHGVVEAKRVADRNHPFAYLETIRIAQIRRREISFGFDFDHRDISFRIAANDLGIVLGIVGQPDDNLLRVLYNVIVGQDRAIAIDDKAGAGT